jgi:hypothetical protein
MRFSIKATSWLQIKIDPVKMQLSGCVSETPGA